MTEVFLRTERLVLRRLTMADADLLASLDSDPAVMRLLTNGVPTPRSEIVDVVLPRVLADYDRTGLGWFAAEHEGSFIGWIGLRPGPGPDEAELGYRLRRAAWGRGFATEGARALVRAAFTDLGLRRVHAQTMAVNAASRRVLERAGLRHVRTFHLHFDDPIPGTEHGEVEYELLRADWKDPGAMDDGDSADSSSGL